MSGTHAARAIRSAVLLTLVLLPACAPVRNYGETQVVAAKCKGGDELRRGERPNAKAGKPAPVTPADSVEQPKQTAAQIKCHGGLSQ